MFSPNDKRAMNQGFGDGMSRAFELVATPFVFGGLGYLLDRLSGTSPVLVVVLGAFGVIGTFVRFWIGYDAEMRAHESSALWAPRVPDARTEPEVPIDLWNVEREAGA